jgi:hypothetical protein
MGLTMKLTALETAPFGAGAIDFYTRIKTVYLDYSA